MKKILLKLSLILALIAGLLYLESSQLAPVRFKTRLETISSPLIPNSHNNLTIAILSDLKGDMKALVKAQKALHQSQSEVVILMGDTFGDLDGADLKDFQDTLQSITPKYGKFIILSSEADRDSYDNLGFHIVTTTLLKLYTDTQDFIHLQTANSDVPSPLESPESFNLLVSNQNTVKDTTGFNVIVHPLDEQAYVKIPKLLNDGKKKTVIDGVTTLNHMGSNTLSKYRLLTHPEILLLTLKSQ